MKRHPSLPLTAISCLVAFLLCLSAQASAQTAIITAPSTDVLEPGRLYLELGFVAHPEPHQHGGFHSLGIKAVRGFKGRFEGGVNIAFTNALEPNQPVDIQPNFKWVFYHNEERGLAVATGGIVFIPGINRGGNKTLGMTYVVASKKVKGDYAPRLTSGIYSLLGQAGAGITRIGAITGLEQPLHPRVSFFADWMSGSNRVGYASAGLSISVKKRGVLGISYNFGNTGRKNNTLNVSYGMTF